MGVIAPLVLSLSKDKAAPMEQRARAVPASQFVL